MHRSHGLMNQQKVYSKPVTVGAYLADISEDIQYLNLLQPISKPLVQQIYDATSYTLVSSCPIFGHLEASRISRDVPEQNSIRINTSYPPLGSRE